MKLYNELYEFVYLMHLLEKWDQNIKVYHHVVESLMYNLILFSQLQKLKFIWKQKHFLFVSGVKFYSNILRMNDHR